MKNLLFTDHKVKNQSFRAKCSEIIDFHDVLIVLNLEDLLRTIKSLFLNNNNNNNNNNNTVMIIIIIILIIQYFTIK